MILMRSATTSRSVAFAPSSRQDRTAPTRSATTSGFTVSATASSGRSATSKSAAPSPHDMINSPIPSLECYISQPRVTGSNLSTRPRIDLIDDLEVGENLPRLKLFDFPLVQAVEPIKERPLVRRQFRMLFGARHGDSEHGARSTFIFAASLARSRPKSRRLSSRRALRAARQVLEFLSASFSRTTAPWTL